MLAQEFRAVGPGEKLAGRKARESRGVPGGRYIYCAEGWLRRQGVYLVLGLRLWRAPAGQGRS
jgi:hypothetical protein